MYWLKKKSYLLCFLLLALNSFNCSNVTEKKRDPKKILFLGESTTNGLGATQISNNYVSRTIEGFRNLSLPIEYKVIAKNGMTSSWGVLQIEDVIRYRPDFFIIEFAINDEELSDSEVLSNYLTFKSLTPFTRTIILDLYSSNQYRKFLSTGSKRITSLHGLVGFPNQIDTEPCLPKDWDIYLIDGVHPNDLGYGIVSDCLNRTLYPLLLDSILIQQILIPQ